MNNELYEKLARLQWLLHRQQMHSYRHGGHLADATRGQGRILATLQMKDGISTKDLSYLLGLAVSSLNEFLSKLEKGGYITREPSTQDKRVILVKLTEKGKTQPSQPETEQGLGGIFDCLTEEEQEALGMYLDKVIESLQSKFGFEDDGFERLHAMFEGHENRLAGMGGLDRRGFGRFGHGRGDFGPMGGFRGHGPDGRGHAPNDMPGAERFAPDDGEPMPDGREGFPFGPRGTE